VKLRARNIVTDAIEQAIDSAFPLALSRWFKRREGAFNLETLESREFREHVCSVVYGEVSEAIERVIDLDCEDDSLEPLNAEQRYRIEVYQGGGGARWLVRGPDGGVMLTSSYRQHIDESLDEAAAFAHGRRLAIVSSDNPPDPAA